MEKKDEETLSLLPHFRSHFMRAVASDPAIDMLPHALRRGNRVRPQILSGGTHRARLVFYTPRQPAAQCNAHLQREKSSPVCQPSSSTA
jgi:hypothetical protein